MKTKKVIAILTVAVMLVLVAACAGQPAGGGGAAASAPAPAAPAPAPAAGGDAPAAGADGLSGHVRFWHHNTMDSRRIPLQEGADEFVAMNPGVTVDVEVHANDVYKTVLRTAMAGGDGPGVFHSWGGGWLRAFVNEGLVVDITSDVQDVAHLFSEAAMGMVTFDNSIWAVPYVNGSTILYYNIDMFNRLGISAPTTFAELEHVAEVLLANGIYPFAEANLTRWPGAQHFVLWSMRIGGADIFERAIAGEISFEHPAFIEAGQMLQDMINRGWFPAGHNGMNWDTGESRMMMYLEQAGMIVQTSGFIGTAFSENPEFFDNLGIAAFPTVAGGAGVATDILAGVNAFSISTFAEDVDAALGLVKHLTTSDTVQQSLADNATIGARTGLTFPSPQLQTAVAQLQSATFLQNFIDQTLTPRLTEAHLGTTQALHGLTMTPEEAAAYMQAAFLADDGSFD